MYPYIILFKKNNQQCFLPIDDLKLPIDSKEIKNIKTRHELLCELNSLEKFRCGSEAITYYTIPSIENFVFAIFPQNCGDSEFNTLVVLKNNKIIDELIIDKISETEVDGERALNYTECQIDNNYNIHLTHSTWIEGKSNKQNFKDENLFINDEGKFIRK